MDLIGIENKEFTRILDKWGYLGTLETSYFFIWSKLKIWDPQRTSYPQTPYTVLVNKKMKKMHTCFRIFSLINFENPQIWNLCFGIRKSLSAGLPFKLHTNKECVFFALHPLIVQLGPVPFIIYITIYHIILFRVFVGPFPCMVYHVCNILPYSA